MSTSLQTKLTSVKHLTKQEFFTSEGGTRVHVTPVIVTSVPVAPVPVTPLPVAPVPVTPVPVAPVPVTPVPVAPVSVTPVPVVSVPVTLLPGRDGPHFSPVYTIICNSASRCLLSYKMYDFTYPRKSSDISLTAEKHIVRYFY
jgi:hypothetical protein